MRQCRPGTTPPLILNYNASTVPILQMALLGMTGGAERIWPTSASVPAAYAARNRARTQPYPYPFGGEQRQIQIDLDPPAMEAHHLSAQDVANALAAQNLITPVGTQKMGQFEYTVQLNNSPRQIAALNDLPIKTVNGASSTCATSPTCATAMRRRPISCV